MSDEAKRMAAGAAVELVLDGMRLGIGTGSTAEHFIHLLAQRVKAGLSVTGIATSERSAELCSRLGIPLTNLDETPSLDLAVDGADEFDGALNLIKGGGGALLREKIVAAAAKRFVVIADASKQVAVLGAFPLPVEIIPMARQPLSQRLAKLGAVVALRQTADGKPFRSDENHWILDCAFGPAITDPPRLAHTLSGMPGVVEHGLFCGMTERVLLGSDDQVTVINS
ncbi:MAG: ribose-5-phosphate isomerase RpiA [Alphaproteobacteria bacterium]|nr:ribose-5-phosphate isomerase RpiA [Alphaproteobacteria bacterium]MBL6954277.1 ribose-5-phosphate isomerase RpiA [Alphaproteobacteria bacterium]